MTSFTPPEYLSPSSLGTFNQCQQKFKFTKIDALVDDPSEATLMGNFVHDILEELYKREPSERTLNNAKTIASVLWNETWSDQVLPWVKGAEELRMFRWKSRWCVENLWKIENPEMVAPTGLEQEVNGEIGGVKIRGFIDRYSVSENGLITVSDYKTGKTPKPHYAQDKFLQLYIYSALLNQDSLFGVDSVELLYLKDGVKLKNKVTEKKLEETTVYIRDTKLKVDKACESGIFTSTISILCDWCSFKPICPGWNSND